MTNDRRDRIETMLHVVLASPPFMDFCVRAGAQSEQIILDKMREANPQFPTLAATGLAIAREAISLARLLVTLVDTAADSEEDPIAAVLRRFEGTKQ